MVQAAKEALARQQQEATVAAAVPVLVGALVSWKHTAASTSASVSAH